MSIRRRLAAIPRKFATARRKPLADIFLMFEAAVFLGIARAVILTVPFRRIQPWMAKNTLPADPDAVLIKRVRKAVMAAARNVPWEAVCLPQAMAAKAMLARRDCRSTIHFGAGFAPEGKLMAHAWLVASDRVVVGEGAIATVTPLVRFG